jgi:group I intron endonuclease
MASGIYEIVNKANGKRYIGSAINIKRRWNVHRSDLRLGSHHSRALQRAWNKYGDDQFDFRVVELCAKGQLLSREQWHLDVGRPEYNCSPSAGTCLGIKRDEAFRLKISKARLGKPLSEQHRSAIGRSLIGLKRSMEAIEKSAAAKRGRKLGPLSDEHRRKIGAAQPSARPPEFGAAISQAKKGKPRPDMVGNRFGSIERSAEHRANMSAAQKGRPKSPETVERMKAAWIKRKERSASI